MQWMEVLEIDYSRHGNVIYVKDGIPNSWKQLGPLVMMIVIVIFYV